MTIIEEAELYFRVFRNKRASRWLAANNPSRPARPPSTKDRSKVKAARKANKTRRMK